MKNSKKNLFEKKRTPKTTPKVSGSNLIKLTGAFALLALFMGIGITSKGQTLVNKKEYEEILDMARNSQESIGEDMAQFLFGGGGERWLQIQIEKQNSKHGEKYNNEKFSLFKDEEIQDRDSDEKILNVEEMEEYGRNIIDSLTREDAKTFFMAFQDYQASGVNLVGKKGGKGDYIHPGWAYAEFPVDMHIDYLKNNKKLPYTKKEQETLQAEYEKIREDELSKWKKQAEKNRKSMEVGEYESANLLALEETRQVIAEKIYKKFRKPMVQKAIKGIYSREKDASN